MWGVLTVGNQYVPAVCQLFCATRGVDFNQSEWRRLASRAWLVYFGSVLCVSKTWTCSFIWLYSTKITFWKPNHACDHAENRSLTCGKDRATNCYSLIHRLFSSTWRLGLLHCRLHTVALCKAHAAIYTASMNLYGLALRLTCSCWLVCMGLGGVSAEMGVIFFIGVVLDPKTQRRIC